MTADEVDQAFLECYGELPTERYFGFDGSNPIKSGSIASVYLAQKPVADRRGKLVLTPVVVKVGRHNLEQEFLIGKTVIKLAILSSQYWAPHSKLSPFLSSWLGPGGCLCGRFPGELDFESEARNQARFAQRQENRTGTCPRYTTAPRIIEMEFVDEAASLNSAFRTAAVAGWPARSGRLAARSAHSDTAPACLPGISRRPAPGNILVANSDQLYLIDWGNTVDISAIWKPALKYLQAVLAGTARRSPRRSSNWVPTASRWKPAARTWRNT